LLDGTPYTDFGKEVIPNAISSKKVFAYFFDGYWEDIGTIGAFFEAHVDLTRPLPLFNFYDEEAPIYSHPRFLPGAKVLNAHTENTVLCDGSIVNPSRISRSIIGIRSIVGKNCNLDEVVMMGADYFETFERKEKNREMSIPDVGIGENTTIKRAIIDKNARIGNNVQLINHRGVDKEEGEHHFIRDGIIVIPKNGIVPDNTAI
jgi:glucose-1-phosphate adenylyltransferase